MKLVRFVLLPLLAVLSFALPLFAHSSSESRADSCVLRLGDVTYMNGKGMGVEALERLQSAHGKRFFWFRRGGKAYLVTNAGELERAEAIILPQSELGRKQSALGSKQAELGSPQGRLGRREGEVGMPQAGGRGGLRQG